MAAGSPASSSSRIRPSAGALDWEDFDLFRTAGIQAASYIAEARSQQALADAQRFDEFNRRFAFIMHDIKNLVSQLSLVARNAERHADNPEFRADMIATLQSSVEQDERPARPPFARRGARGRAAAPGRGPAAGRRDRRGQAPRRIRSGSSGDAGAGRQGRSGRARAGARPSRPERDRGERAATSRSSCASSKAAATSPSR